MITVWKNIGVLRGAAIICVVLNHATLAQRVVHESWAGGALPYTALERVIITLGCTIPVAAIAGFMVAAGYLAGRFSSTWPAARASVRSLLGRYVAWSILGFLALGLLRRRFDMEFMASRMAAFFGPFPAYWFFVSLILFSLLAPALTALAKRHPLVLLALFVMTEGLRAILFYSGVPVSNLLTPLQGSYFVLGVLLSQHSNAVVAQLVPHRTLVLIAAVLMLGLACLETTYFWDVAGFPDGNAISADRTALRVYAVLITTWFLLRESRQSIVSTWLDRIGMRSLAIFLSFDFLQWCVFSFLWHLSERPLGSTGSGFEAPPSLMRNPAWIAVYFGVGLLGPLAAVAALERLAGKRWRQFVFG